MYSFVNNLKVPWSVFEASVLWFLYRVANPGHCAENNVVRSKSYPSEFKRIILEDLCSLSKQEFPPLVPDALFILVIV